MGKEVVTDTWYDCSRSMAAAFHFILFPNARERCQYLRGIYSVLPVLPVPTYLTNE